ncbi:MAG: hypothetical protein Q4P66_00920 [Actinomycetaceae bacterium]|nr:hypothetical protein [Actinomycetaceae bacterium]
MSKCAQGGAPEPRTTGHNNNPVPNSPDFLGPGDDGATQSFPHFQGSERSYTSDEALSLYRSKLPPRAQRRQQHDLQRIEHETQPAPITPGATQAMRSDAQFQESPALSNEDNLEATQAMPPISVPGQGFAAPVMAAPVPPTAAQPTYPGHTMQTQTQGVHVDAGASTYPPIGSGPNTHHSDYNEDGEPQSNTKLIISIIIVLLMIVTLVGVIVWKTIAQTGGEEENLQQTEQTTEITQTTPEDETSSEPSQVNQEPTTQPSQTKKPEPAPTKTVTQTVPAQPTPGETTPAQPSPSITDAPSESDNNPENTPASPAN